MSGPKEIKFKRELSYREFGALSERLTKIANKNNYMIEGQPRKNMDTVHLVGVHRFNGTKINLSTRRKETTMGVEIEDSDSCNEIITEVVEALNEECPGIVEKWSKKEEQKQGFNEKSDQKEKAQKTFDK